MFNSTLSLRVVGSEVFFCFNVCTGYFDGDEVRVRGREEAGPRFYNLFSNDQIDVHEMQRCFLGFSLLS